MCARCVRPSVQLGQLFQRTGSVPLLLTSTAAAVATTTTSSSRQSTPLPLFREFASVGSRARRLRDGACRRRDANSRGVVGQQLELCDGACYRGAGCASRLARIPRTTGWSASGRTGWLAGRQGVAQPGGQAARRGEREEAEWTGRAGGLAGRLNGHVAIKPKRRLSTLAPLHWHARWSENSLSCLRGVLRTLRNDSFQLSAQRYS